MIFTIQVLENGTRSVSVGVGVSQKGAVQCRPQVLNSKFTIITQHQVLDAMTGNMVDLRTVAGSGRGVQESCVFDGIPRQIPRSGLQM